MEILFALTANACGRDVTTVTSRASGTKCSAKTQLAKRKSNAGRQPSVSSGGVPTQIIAGISPPAIANAARNDVSLRWPTLRLNEARQKLKSQFSLPRRHATRRFRKIFVIDLAAMSQRGQAIAVLLNTAQMPAVMRCAGCEIVIADVSSDVEQGVAPEQ